MHPRLFRARKIVPHLAFAVGRDLFEPVRILDNAAILVADGRIAAVGKVLHIPAGCETVDLGDVTLLPPLVNAHTHLELSWLAGRTLWGYGFPAWLNSMVPQIIAARGVYPDDDAGSLAAAFHQLAESGTGLAGDIGGSLRGSLGLVRSLADKYGFNLTHFCEWLGFGPVSASPWPPACRDELAVHRRLASLAAPAGHALYSTSGEILRAAHRWCMANGRVFSFHLAESLAETEMLLTGEGELAAFYRQRILPPGWRPPGVRPLRYAEDLGLLRKGSLCVHGARLAQAELSALAQSGASLCICARSNHNLGVGEPPLLAAIAARVPLCLGTDGLTSSPDLDLRREILYIHEKLDMPLPVLWRLATANGALALGQPEPALVPGAPARFCLWPSSA